MKDRKEETDKAHIEDDGGSRVLSLEVVYSNDETVVGQEKANPCQQEGQIDATAGVLWGFSQPLAGKCCGTASSATRHPVHPRVGVSLTQLHVPAAQVLVHCCSSVPQGGDGPLQTLPRRYSL